MIRRSDIELGRNRSLTTNLYDLEAKQRKADEVFNALRHEQDEVRFTN